MRGVTYPEELKAEVIAEWEIGATLGQLATRFQIPRATVQDWTRHRVRTAVIQQPDLRERLSYQVYDALTSLLQSIAAHARAAEQGAATGLETEGWLARLRTLTDTALIIGGAMERGQAQQRELTAGEPPGSGEDR